MDETVGIDHFESSYERGSPPWVIGEPQPAVAELAAAGAFSGTVLDAGCGAGEHTILLARLGLDVLGIDASPRAIELARRTAAAQGVEARFELADALRLAGPPRFDTVIDSALFHVFGPADQAAYARALAAACRPGAVVHVLALSDAQPGFGPRIPASRIRDAFADGWRVEITESRYRGYPDESEAAELGVEPGSLVDAAAWLATARLP